MAVSVLRGRPAESTLERRPHTGTGAKRPQLEDTRVSGACRRFLRARGHHCLELLRQERDLVECPGGDP